jgi:hypothetical protein
LYYDTHLMQSGLSPTSRQSRAVLMLVIGLMVMAMLSLGSNRPAHADNGFYGEICTGKGIQSTTPIDVTGANGQSQPQPAVEHNDCCKLCGSASPLLKTDDALAVPPAPNFTLSFDPGNLTPPATTARLHYPPRGPPLL